MDKVITGSVINAWVVLDGFNILAAFPREDQAKYYIEENGNNHNFSLKKYAAFLYLDGNRVSLFDPAAVHFVYEFCVDFEPAAIQKEKELKAQALSKLSPEERKVLGFK